MTFADKLWDVLMKARARHPEQKLSEADWKKNVNETAAAHFKRRKPSAPLEQEKVREALARACGIIAIGQITEAGWIPIRRALSDIRKVFNGTDEELILEVQRRAAAYRTRHPTWDLTPSSLAKYWANFGRLAKEVESAPPEPVGWVAFCRENFVNWVRFVEEEREQIPLPPWARLRRDEQGWIIDAMKKEGKL